MNMISRPRFRDVVKTEAQLRAVVGDASQRSLDKEVTELDDFCRRFIAASPFLIIGSYNAAGEVDLSPKGDPAGFVRVLDDSTLVIPDRPGNRRLDTFRNLLDNGRIGLFFLVPGKRETLRVIGSAQIVRDADLRETMAVNGKAPQFAIVVTVERAFFHCAKCVMRSKLWQPEHWPDLDGLPTMAEVLVAQGAERGTVKEVTAALEQQSRDSLY